MIEKNDAEINLARVHDWTKASDQKASIILAFQGVLLTSLFPLIFRWFWKNGHDFVVCEIVCLLIAVMFLLLGVVKSFSAVLPRINNNAKNKSLTFFGHIASESLAEYKERLAGSTERDLLDDLISQTHVSAKIALVKHKELRHSMISFAIGISILAGVYFEFVIRRILC